MNAYPTRSSGEAVPLTFQACQQIRAQFTTDSFNDRAHRIAWTYGDHNFGGHGVTLSDEGEQEFARRYPECAAMLQRCLFPWERTGDQSSYATFRPDGPVGGPSYSFCSEADRQAWIAANPGCGAPPIFRDRASTRSYENSSGCGQPDSILVRAQAETAKIETATQTGAPSAPIVASESLWARTPAWAKVAGGVAVGAGLVWAGSRLLRR